MITETPVFFLAYFIGNILFSCMITWMKNVNNFQIEKVQPKVVA